MPRVISDLSLSACVAGLISTLIAYAGPLVIVFQASDAGGLSSAQVASWVWTLSIGSGVLSIALSLRHRAPIIMAWSAPGAALLVAMLAKVPYSEAIGAFVVVGAVLLVVGVSGAFDRIVAWLPAPIAAAMLAGILFEFGAAVFKHAAVAPELVLGMFAVYLVGRRWFPQYAVMAVLAGGICIAAAMGMLNTSALSLGLALPQWEVPTFTASGVINIALPLVVVTLTGQFMPGMVVLRTHGYDTPAKPLVTASAIGTLLLAPFGCHGLNLAAITAAICSGPDAHPDPARRYITGVAAGVSLLVLGTFGATLVSLFSILPKELIAALAGLALFGPIANSLTQAVQAPDTREAALVTFLVTVSGMSIVGLSAAFWGLVIGITAHVILSLKKPRSSGVAAPGKSAVQQTGGRAT